MLPPASGLAVLVPLLEILVFFAESSLQKPWSGVSALHQWLLSFSIRELPRGIVKTFLMSATPQHIRCFWCAMICILKKSPGNTGSGQHLEKPSSGGGKKKKKTQKTSSALFSSTALHSSHASHLLVSFTQSVYIHQRTETVSHPSWWHGLGAVPGTR